MFLISVIVYFNLHDYKISQICTQVLWLICLKCTILYVIKKFRISVGICLLGINFTIENLKSLVCGVTPLTDVISHGLLLFYIFLLPFELILQMSVSYVFYPCLPWLLLLSLKCSKHFQHLNVQSHSVSKKKFLNIFSLLHFYWLCFSCIFLVEWSSCGVPNSNTFIAFWG